MKRLLHAGLCIAGLSGGAAASSAVAAPRAAYDVPGSEAPSRDAQRVAGLVIAAKDNHGLPFVIVDKVQAQVFVFYPDGTLRGASPVLIGSAVGDESAPGVGQRSLADIGPQERTTPAGRFVASIGNDLGQKDIVWVDYDAAISLHRVITSNVKERRAQRLATASPLDNRISYGCINVPARFYDNVVQPAFTGTNGVVYILPEVRSMDSVFAFAKVAAKPLNPSPDDLP